MQQISDGERIQDVITLVESRRLQQKGGVIELVVVDRGDQTYQIDVVVQWHSRRKTLDNSPGAPQKFGRLGTLVRYHKTVGIGRTLVRFEMAPTP